MANPKKTLAEKLHARRLKKPPALIYRTLGYLWRFLYFKKLGVQVDLKKIRAPAKAPTSW